MRMFRLALLAFLAAGPASAQTLTTCDQLAGYPMTPRGPRLPGIAQVNHPDRAIAACEEARRTDSDPFLAFLLARALEAADPDDPRLPDLIAEGAAASAPFAASRMGILYDTGRGGLAQDTARARALAAESCDARPDPRALPGCNNLAAMMTGPDELADAAALYDRTCSEGFGLACSNLADRIAADTAPGYPPSRVLALYERGCDLSDSWGCVMAGYTMTVAETPDNDGAARRFLRACDLGDGEGCYRLGLLTRDRTDTEPDWDWAQESFLRGCDDGHQEACYNRALGLSYGYDSAGGGTDAGDHAAAVALFTRLCDERHADACMDLGYLYAEGQAVAQDSARGVELSARACALGSALGCNNLGVHLATAEGIAQNMDLAARYYEQGCAGESGLACYNLGDMIAGGDLGTPDMPRAQALFRKACDLGEPDGCGRLP
ncbi:MAG: sel1 repeat family protein [Rhodobacteraceae bacterium]|nr:sel1 repeat family protein [Paracoccaceae bacterium]